MVSAPLSPFDGRPMPFIIWEFDIISDPAALYVANFNTLLLWLLTDLLHWHMLTLTWFGRCSALKMTLLPRILYLMQALPIHLPTSFFKCINALF